MSHIHLQTNQSTGRQNLHRKSRWRLCLTGSLNPPDVTSLCLHTYSKDHVWSMMGPPWRVTSSCALVFVVWLHTLFCFWYYSVVFLWCSDRKKILFKQHLGEKKLKLITDICYKSKMIGALTVGGSCIWLCYSVNTSVCTVTHIMNAGRIITAR